MVSFINIVSDETRPPSAAAYAQGETLEPGIAMQKVQEEAETTLGMLAFDAFPRFLKSKYCNAVMDDLKKGSNANEVRNYT